ncbi:MAG: formylglycine-generating enzyme family protein [Bacteroidales bacterium]
MLVVSCGDDDNEEDVQASASNQNGGNGSSDNGNGGGSVNDGQNKVYTVNGVSFKMIAVKGGTFQMGSDDGYEWEKPVHQVTLSDYYIGETEVTQELWTAVMGSNPLKFTGNMQRPVEMVSWNDCQTFISKLNELTGETFRLPTEAQWEYAARGGNKSKGYTYSGGDAIDDVAWHEYNSGGITHPVKTKAPNELGIYDMTGNVYEWCSDWYGSYSSAAQTDPTGPSTGSYRLIRGGSWGSDATYCRVASRGSSTPTFSYISLGLRLAH